MECYASAKGLLTVQDREGSAGMVVFYLQIQYFGSNQFTLRTIIKLQRLGR